MDTELNVGNAAVHRKKRSPDAPPEPGDAAFDANASRIVSMNGEKTQDDFKGGEAVWTNEHGKCTILYDGATSCHSGKIDIMAEGEKQHSVTRAVC